ncbi:hypothetical protein I4U23_026710 [Adineta vaga]|nr:hypothetical protein I4U23_026710 [Adineta vaga]
MNLGMNNDDFLREFNRSLRYNFPKKLFAFSQPKRSFHPKVFSNFQIIEICFLIFILIEHTFIFLLTFQKKPSKTNRKISNQFAIDLPSKTFLYCCLHRNWIRAFSFTNMCLSCVYFVKLLLKHYHPNLVHHSSITFYSLPLNLLQQILVNFSTFHLLIISISVFQYFLRYYRLMKNTYSSYFFNEQNLLLTRHTNVALILSGSLALIFAYNFIFYAPKHPQTLSLLPLVTFNMILLPLINFIILLFLIICFILSFSFKTDVEYFSVDDDPENLRLIIEKNTCIKCYSKILRNNPNLFQDNNYSYRNLYKHFFPTNLRSSYPFQTKRIYHLSPTKENYSHEELNESEINPTDAAVFKTTLIQLNHQHSLCHLCYYLLAIFLLKYILFTFPQYILQMLFHFKQFYYFILKKNYSNNITDSLYENYDLPLKLFHFLFLISRFGDSFLLIRLSYFMKKYFPCWCHFNSKLLRRRQQQQLSHQILTMKTSISSTNNEGISGNDVSKGNETIERSHWKRKHCRFRFRFQFVPLWSTNGRKLFNIEGRRNKKENIEIL